MVNGIVASNCVQSAFKNQGKEINSIGYKGKLFYT